MQIITKKIVSAGTQNKGAYVAYKGTKTVLLDNIGPMLDRKGNPILATADSKCQFHVIGYKPKNVMLYSINEADKTAAIAWTFFCSYERCPLSETCKRLGRILYQ